MAAIYANKDGKGYDHMEGTGTLVQFLYDEVWRVARDEKSWANQTYKVKVGGADHAIVVSPASGGDIQIVTINGKDYDPARHDALLETPSTDTAPIIDLSTGKPIVVARGNLVVRAFNAVAEAAEDAADYVGALIIPPAAAAAAPMAEPYVGDGVIQVETLPPPPPAAAPQQPAPPAGGNAPGWKVLETNGPERAVGELHNINGTIAFNMGKIDLSDPNKGTPNNPIKLWAHWDGGHIGYDANGNSLKDKWDAAVKKYQQDMMPNVQFGLGGGGKGDRASLVEPAATIPAEDRTTLETVLENMRLGKLSPVIYPEPSAQLVGLSGKYNAFKTASDAGRAAAKIVYEDAIKEYVANGQMTGIMNEIKGDAWAEYRTAATLAPIASPAPVVALVPLT
ncbi:MAG: hypothetical protein ACPGRX_05490 [Bdellovibrionales bacterium]